MNSENNESSPCLAIFGTGSEVGKSIVATAVCRFLANRGIRTAPFKAQNMSNNSGVTPEGLEMGRAQIVQAEAAKIPPHVDMNPILLKPTTDVGSQVVCLGEAVGNSSASEYHKKKETLFSTACQAFDRLRKAYDVIVMEGAGSCAEVNLMPTDIVNFRMAEYADAPVILVADIHRGGVFAQIVGTLECIEQKYRDRIAGIIINRFRGDISLFEDGVRWIEQKTGKKVLGVLPWYSHFHIEAEDSVVLENIQKASPEKNRRLSVAVIRIPHISNFTDFDPLSDLKGLQLYFIGKVQDISHFKAVILPGSKNTRFDLNWLKESGWSEVLKKYAADGGHILGICGGYQMMGNQVHDPDGLEGTPGSTEGLSLLPVETFLQAPKTTTLSRFYWKDISQDEEHNAHFPPLIKEESGNPQNICGTGYEIHMGQTRRFGGEPLFSVFERNSIPCNHHDGCAVSDFRIIGTYMHGLFDTPAIAKFWLNSIGLDHIEVSKIQGVAARDQAYELLAAHFEKHTDTKYLLETLKIF